MAAEQVRLQDLNGDGEDELLRIQRQSGKTILFIPHNIDEAIVLGHRIVVMSARPGRIRRIIPNALPQPRVVLNLSDRPAGVGHIKGVVGNHVPAKILFELLWVRRSRARIAFALAVHLVEAVGRILDEGVEQVVEVAVVVGFHREVRREVVFFRNDDPAREMKGRNILEANILARLCAADIVADQV